MKTRFTDVKITEPDGTIIFEKKNVEVPGGWSDRAATIAASKYFSHEEGSVLTLVGRVARQIKLWGEEQEYFINETEGEVFMNNLEEVLLQQRAAFNSPVWFNVGVAENDDQVAGCFIYDVKDNMEDILEHSKREGLTFKSGSGAGVNVSNLRSKGELLSNRGVASGPLSFMRIWDQTAGSIKSGGKTRRSAKMVNMDVDHPDIEEFIDCKLHEEKKAQLLINNGVPVEEAYATVAFQNANHSIMVTDKFMRAVESDSNWDLINRGDGEVAKTVKAKELFRKIARIAWATGDPGLQFYDRINVDNPVPSMGNIVCSNPCSEHFAVNGSACNLASLNLVEYLDEDYCFNKELFVRDIDTIITAQDIMIDMADYPTEHNKQVAMDTRPLGLGFANLGAYLMLKQLPYDSVGAREEAQKITRLMSQSAYVTSIGLAMRKGSFAEFNKNKERNIDIAKRLTGDSSMYNLITSNGLRNSQLTCLAPTGTISFLMDCDSSGIEPLFSLKSYKNLTGGGVMEINPGCVNEICNEIRMNNHSLQTNEKIINSEGFGEIFKTANEISPHAHMAMMEACQVSLNGAISKTVNMPSTATVEDVEDAYLSAWSMGLKAIAIYRDGCKQMQPLTTSLKQDDKEDFDEVTETAGDTWSAYRRKLPDTRTSITHKFNVAGLEGYVTCGLYESGDLGEIFIRTQKQGTTVQGLMDSMATAVSLGLQYGVPIETFIDKFEGAKFEPAGITENQDILIAQSLVDYIFRWVRQTFIDEESDEQFIEETPVPNTNIVKAKISFDGPPCTKCQTITGRSGTCYVCSQCGETTGCS